MQATCYIDNRFRVDLSQYIRQLFFQPIYFLGHFSPPSHWRGGGGEYTQGGEGGAIEQIWINCFSKADIGHYIKIQQASRQAKECYSKKSVCVFVCGFRWMWWGLLWTQQVINSVENTVTLHNHWYNYIKKANQSWLYSCFPTCTHTERGRHHLERWKAGLISSSSKKRKKSGTKGKEKKNREMGLRKEGATWHS